MAECPSGTSSDTGVRRLLSSRPRLRNMPFDCICTTRFSGTVSRRISRAKKPGREKSNTSGGGSELLSRKCPPASVMVAISLFFTVILTPDKGSPDDFSTTLPRNRVCVNPAVTSSRVKSRQARVLMIISLRYNSDSSRKIFLMYGVFPYFSSLTYWSSNTIA